MNLVLVGYRGAGKSTVARLLAERLNMEVVATDDLVVKKAGISIPEIVERYGWERFRELEREVVKSCSEKESIIIDCGGGVILKEENVENLKRKGMVIWLKVSPQAVVERIRGDTQRPSLSGRKSFVEEVEEILSERTPKYERVADLVVDTTELNPSEVVEEIISRGIC